MTQHPDLNTIPNYSNGAPFVPFGELEATITLVQFHVREGQFGLSAYVVDVDVVASNSPLRQVGKRYALNFSFKGSEKAKMAELSRVVKFVAAALPAMASDPNGARQFLVDQGADLVHAGIQVRLIQKNRQGKDKDGKPIRNDDGSPKFFTDKSFFAA